MAGKENVRSQRLQYLLPGPGEENLLTPCLRHFGLGFSTYLQPVSPVKILALFFLRGNWTSLCRQGLWKSHVQPD